ncbi:hypothetical protein O181_044346 [Austropuccinia psidii MF-1]|uniref:Major facilitator superfamily (MFS) profile domain-containing protein n=1 Tax=Austropuccinia psidii MF-1 TaxID=1389203 RepID=A0A9Q3DIA3_9BASI|nr:hypothetical protein [Austropuccinia psidii MF-1]
MCYRPAGCASLFGPSWESADQEPMQQPLAVETLAWIVDAWDTHQIRLEGTQTSHDPTMPSIVSSALGGSCAVVSGVAAAIQCPSMARCIRTAGHRHSDSASVDGFRMKIVPKWLCAYAWVIKLASAGVQTPGRQFQELHLSGSPKDRLGPNVPALHHFYFPKMTAQVSDSQKISAPSRKLKVKGLSLVFACGTALFSDGYQNGVIGTVNTLIKRIYANDISRQRLSRYSTTFSSVGFAGIVLGMLIFGVLSDRWGRKNGMITATLIVFVFACMSAGAYGFGGSTIGMLQALSAYRFFGGIGIGAEYPSGSVAAAENTEQDSVPTKAQNGIFALATNAMIDVGFVVSALVPFILLQIFGDEHLRIVWRMSLGLGKISFIEFHSMRAFSTSIQLIEC